MPFRGPACSWPISSSFVAIYSALVVVFISGDNAEMIRLFLSLCCTVSLSFGLCPLLPDVVSLDVDAFADLARDLNAEVEKIVDPAKPSVSIGLVYNQSLIFSKGYGKINVTGKKENETTKEKEAWPNKNSSDPGLGSPTGQTGFRIGSLTKIFIVIWLLQLRDANKLDIDDPVTKYLPNFKINNPFRSRRNVTLRQLACHMGGLAREVPCPGTYDAGCKLSFDKIYDNIAKSSLIYPPGRMPSYSNMGFALLGRALEAYMKTPWEDWIYDDIAKPMNMSNTGARFTSSTVKNLAVGYIDNKEAGLVDIGWEAPAGQMYSSVDDLSKLLMMIFRDRFEYGGVAGQILDGETLREWMEPTYMNVDGTGFGLPWELYPIGKPVANYTVRTKSGAINGYRARFYFLVNLNKFN